MRKRLAIILVFVFMGIGCYLPSSVAMADSDSEMNDNDVPEGGLDSERGEPYLENSVSGNDAAAIPNTENSVSGNDAAAIPNTENSFGGNDAAAIPNAENSVSGENEKIVSLQVPVRVRIIVDPYEIDGNGQIYSEQYVIRNMGSAAGTLTLSNVIRIPTEQDEITGRTENEGLHSGWEKSINMEMVFGNGDKMVFAQEGSAYEVELESGEELAFWFAGEVNENAFQPWRCGDIAVMIDYMWDAEEEDIETGRSGE